MKVKNDNPYELIKDKNLSLILIMYFKINHLKQLYRQGWLRYISKEKCESVADHVFGVAILAVLINDYYELGLDVLKIVIMALFHEMGEIKNGDITPFDGITKEEKHLLEKKGIMEMFKNYLEAEKYISIWKEFEIRKTKEAKFVFQVEKFEMAIQAKIYADQYEIDLSEFQVYVANIITDEFLKDLLHSL